MSPTEHARDAISRATELEEPYRTQEAPELYARAQAFALIAIAEELRTANLIAVLHSDELSALLDERNAIRSEIREELQLSDEDDYS